MKTTSAALAAAAISAAVVLSACGSGAEPAATPTTQASAQAVAPQHGDADVAFARDMIPHHSQAVDMARLAPGRAGADVARLASRIEQAQGPEIEQMRGFLAAWGAPAPASDGMAGMPGMDGMMSDQQMQQLTGSRGDAFDRMFLQMMIRHHEGALTMAGTELSAGQNSEARALAQRIVDAQRAEIGEMRGMLPA